MIAHPLLRNTVERVVERFHVQAEPVAEVLHGGRRHHPVIGDRGARVVDLNQKAGIGDGPVFDPHRVGDGENQLFLALVVLVPAVGDDARRRRDRQEPFRDIDFGERRLEVPDVAQEGVMAGIGDGRDADRFVLPARAAVEASLRPVVRIELGVELGKALPVEAPGERVGGARAPPGAARTRSAAQARIETS